MPGIVQEENREIATKFLSEVTVNARNEDQNRRTISEFKRRLTGMEIYLARYYIPTRPPVNFAVGHVLLPVLVPKA